MVEDLKNSKVWQTRFVIYLIVISVVHGLFGALLGLGDDEAYYWDWSRQLDLSYLDHPPMTAWWIFAFCKVLGTTAIGVRAGALVSSILFTIILYFLSVRMFNSRRTAFLSTVFITTIPLFAVGSFMMVPDAPLSLFWAVALWAFYEIIKTKKRRYWYVVGATFGLGLLSKYNMVALPLCVAVYLALSRADRFWFARKEPYLALIAGSLFFLPVIAWNVINDFPTLSYHLVERNQGFRWSWQPLQLFLAGQLGYYSPIVFLASVWMMVRSLWRGIKKDDPTMLFIAAFSIPYVLLFAIPGSLSPTAKPHWAAMGYITAFLALPQFFEHYWFNRDLRWRKSVIGILIAGMVICALFTSALFLQSAYPVVKMEPRLDTTNELYGWSEAGRAIEAALETMRPQGEVAVVMPRYTLAGQVAFATPSHPVVYSLSHVREQYDFWGRGALDSLIGKNLVVVGDNRYHLKPAENFICDSVIAEPELEYKRAGRVARWFYIYRCYGFRGVKPGIK